MRPLSTELVCVALSRYPTPIADSVRALEASDSAHERRDRVVESFRAVLRTLAAVALAARAGATAVDRSGELGRLLGQLANRGLTDGQWWALTRGAMAPWRRARNDCPVPELAELLFGSGRRRLHRTVDQLLEMRRSETVAHGPTGDADEVARVLDRRLPALEQLLAALGPLWERYRLAVPLARHGQVQPLLLMIGDTPVRGRWRRGRLADGELAAPGDPVLVTADARVALALAPIVCTIVRRDRIAAVAFIDGGGRRGARYLELPDARSVELPDASLPARLLAAGGSIRRPPRAVVRAPRRRSVLVGVALAAAAVGGVAVDRVGVLAGSQSVAVRAAVAGHHEPVTPDAGADPAAGERSEPWIWLRCERLDPD
jgi:hypothetical protein